MSGEVKLSVERYEELREIERANGELTNHKIKELKEEIKSLESGMVRVVGVMDWINCTRVTYITKDESIIRLGDDIQKLTVGLKEKKNELFVVENATFIDRLKYLFTCKFKHD